MIDPSNSITTETLRVVEKIREERWAEARRLHDLIGEHFRTSHINAHTADALAEKLREVDELDAALMVLQSVWNEPKTSKPVPVPVPVPAAPFCFAVGARVRQVSTDDVLFPADMILTVIDPMSRSAMRVRAPEGDEHLVCPAAYELVAQ